MSVCLLADNALWNGLTRQQQWVHAAAKPNTKMSIVKYKQVIIDISLSTEKKTEKTKTAFKKVQVNTEQVFVSIKQFRVQITITYKMTLRICVKMFCCEFNSIFTDYDSLLCHKL